MEMAIFQGFGVIAVVLGLAVPKWKGFLLTLLGAMLLAVPSGMELSGVWVMDRSLVLVNHFLLFSALLLAGFQIQELVSAAPDQSSKNDKAAS